MATIELYKDKINSMSNYIQQAKNAVSDFCVDLSALKSKILGINSSVCDNVVSSISSSSQTQEQQIAGLEATQKEVNAFIDLTINRDNSAAAAVSKAKDDFYKEYSYLKPECEKSDWEKFCDGLKKVGDWCKDHWKLIVTVVICIAAIALICTGVGGILGAAAIGALMGAGSGGLMGGISSVLSGGSFLDGFEEGAFSGAISGAIMGGIGGAGALFGKSVSCLSKLGKAIKITAKVSGGMSSVMGGFDTLAMCAGMIDPDNPLTALNDKLHQSKLYNGFQEATGVIATFTGGASSTMACFIAGTYVLALDGFKRIEDIVVGDKILTADPDTFEIAEKTVLETYVRQVDKLVHITINGEEIITTDNHPFYVQGRGFIQAGDLLVGDRLISVNGDDLLIEDYYTELTEEPVSVYNFQVENFHTYFVGDCAVWVHNKNCPPHMNEDGTLKPNQEYTTGENNYKYKTDSNGNIASAHADELKLKTHDGRLSHKPNTPGKLSGDDAGHLFADQFGGSPDLDNLVSQRSDLNRAVKNTDNYRSMEREWSKALKSGQKVTDVDIKLTYENGSSRPSSFKVTYKIDGESFRRIFNQ